MRNLFLMVFMILGFSLYAFAQSSPAVQPAPAAVAVAAPAPAVAPASASPLSASFIGIIIAIVACLNIALSAVQQIFSALSKSEPGWLQTVSGFVLTVAKYLGSNPDVASKPKV